MSETGAAPHHPFRVEDYGELAAAFKRLQAILKNDAGLWTGWLQPPSNERRQTTIAPVEVIPVQVSIELYRLTQDDAQAWVRHLILGCEGWLRLPSDVVLGPIASDDQLDGVGLGGEFSPLQGEWCVDGDQSVAVQLEKADTWIATAVTETAAGRGPRSAKSLGNGLLLSRVSFPALAVTEHVHGLIRKPPNGTVPGRYRYRTYWAAEHDAVTAASPSGLQRIAASLGLARPDAAVPASELRCVAARFAGFADKEGGTS